VAFLAADAPGHFARVRGVADTTQAYGFGDRVSSETLYRSPLAADSARSALVTVTTGPDGTVTSRYQATFGLASGDAPFSERRAVNEAVALALMDTARAALPSWTVDSGVMSRLRVQECPGFHGRTVEIASVSDGVRLEVLSGERPCLPQAEQALLAAAASGDTAAIEAALDAGTPIEVAGDERGPYSGTPLLVAARGEHAGAVRLLLTRGADPEATDPEGFAAITNAPLAIARLLIEAGAEVNVPQDRANRAPLATATIDDDIDLMRLLLEAGADPDAQLPVLNNQGAIHFAATNASPAAVRLLLGAGADPDLADALGYTALLYTASGEGFETPEAAIAMARLLLDAGADVNRPSNDFNSYAWTPLMEAARNGQTGIVRFLLTVEGVDLAARNTDAQTALGAARESGFDETAAVLEAAGVPE
jgi:ankyrin repeat protein